MSCAAGGLWSVGRAAKTPARTRLAARIAPRQHRLALYDIGRFDTLATPRPDPRGRAHVGAS